jgi:cell division protein FtsW
MLFLGRVRIVHLLKIGGSAIVLILLFGLFIVLAPTPIISKMGRMETWQGRLKTFVAKTDTNKKYGDNIEIKDENNFQANHAKIAIASGGLFGIGPGQSIERNFLPEAYADFIFAIIIEEYGMILGIIMLLLYLIFMYRTVNIIKKAPKAFGALIAVGLSFQFVLQALINMAVAVGLLPVTGLTLPLVSKGGTSLIFTFITLGLIMSVSRFIEVENKEEENENVDSKNNNFIST